MCKKWLFLLLTVGLLWGGIGLLVAQEEPVSKIDSKAKELMTQAVYNLMEAKAFCFEFQMNAEINYIDGQKLCKFKALTTGVYQQSGLAYFKTRARGQELELYQYEGIVISRDTPEGEWMHSTSVQQLPSPKDTMTLFMDNLDYARLSDKERVKGIECQILDIGLTPTGLKKLMETQAPELTIDGNIPKVSNLIVVIGINDGNIYKLSYTMEIVPKSKTFDEDESIVPEKVGTKLDLNALLFDYDKDIDIELPDKVKELLQIEEPVEKPIEEPAEESLEEPTEEPSEEPTEESTEESPKEPSDE